jgi:hypothetical protein
MVHVRGILERGDSEDGPWVGGQCRAHIEVAGRKFPDGILLQASGNLGALMHPVDFNTDENALGEMQALWQRVDEKKEHVIGTVVGVFETRTPLTELIQENRPFPWNGFGHLGGSPAQIIVKTITDMHIVPNHKRYPSAHGAS